MEKQRTMKKGWRRIVIIMIGAPSCTGKTLMAQRLMERYAVPYYSIDHLKMGIYKAWKGCGYHPEDDDEHIAGILWPVVRETVHTAIENHQHLIVEGCYYFPEHAREWTEPYASQIVSVFVVFSPQYIERNFNHSILPYRTIIEDRPEEGRSVDTFLQDHARYQQRCLANGVDFFEIRDNYEEEMKAIYAWIHGRISAMG